MGLYDFKEFLTFDDVAEYLTDKGVYKFDTLDNQSRTRLYSLLYELVASEKLTPIFRYNGMLKEVSTFEQKIITGNKIFLFNYAMIETWINSDFFPYFETNENDLSFAVCYAEYGTNEHFYMLEDKNPKYGNEPLFPKAQLDTLFLQHQKDNLQQQINAIDSQLDDKELPTRTANNASKIILAMAELLGWDLSKPFADDTNGKIREILKKQGNSLSKDTVADWLRQAYDIGK